MRKIIAVLCALAWATASAQVTITTTSANRPASTSVIPSGAALPATCVVGALFFNTSADAGKNLYECTATNTWTAPNAVDAETALRFKNPPLGCDTDKFATGILVNGTLVCAYVTAGAATVTTNLAGGAGGQIPYQSAVDTTAFLANGTAGQVLASQGTTLAPHWISAPTGTVTSVGITGTANEVTVTGTSPITGSGSLTLSIPASAQLSVAKLTNLNTNGFVKTGAADGTLSVDTSTYLTGNQTVTLSGDASGSGATAITVTNAKVNGVAYPASPSTNTVPVVTGANTITYEAVPNAALANSSMTIAGHSVALGGTQAISASDVGLGSVTNDAQTKAAVVPNTAPAAGQVLVGNAGGTAYAPETISGSGATITLGATGVVTISAIANASLANSSMSIAGHSVSLGGTQAIACGDLSNGATGCSTATGTSGATIPLLNGTNTWSATQTHTSAAPQVVLGVNTTTLGAIKMFGNTSGDVTIEPSAVAGTSTVVTFPAVTGTVVVGATSTTTTQALFATATAGAPAFRAIAAGDLPSTLTSGTAITNGALTTPTINTAASVGGTWTAAATWTLPALTLGGTVSGGSQTLNNLGDTNIGAVGTVKQVSIGLSNVLFRIRERDAVNDVGMSVNMSDSGTQDDSGKSSWKIKLGPNADRFAVARSAAGVNSFADLLTVSSVGNTNVAGTLAVTGAYYSGATIGVTCSGTPTASFASTLGIVTHC